MEAKGMIDVGDKNVTQRIAKAQAFVKINKAILKRIKEDKMPKGNVLECARTAGILAAKKTYELIPLCHNINMELVGVDFVFKSSGILVQALAKATAKTGVEMEALIAVSVAALTIYDMCKMFAQNIEITDVYLLEKTGGKSGYKRRG